MAAIASAGLPEGFVLATKVDPLIGSTDFSSDRVRASVAESLQRLRLDRLQLVYLHDPEKISFESGMARGGPVEALIALREEGVIEHLGVAGGPIDLMLRYIETDIFDVALSHNRYTLVDQSASVLIEAAARRRIGFVNAAPFGGGILVKGPQGQPKYSYAPASADILDRIGRIDRLCQEHDVPLAALALQFSLRNHDIASTVIGMSDPERVSSSIRLAEWPIPETLWSQLGFLIGSTAS
jgi:D-threo-aldose 1-dehydrogenase